MGKAEGARAIEPLCMLWCVPGFLRNDWMHEFKVVRYRHKEDCCFLRCRARGAGIPYPHSTMFVYVRFAGRRLPLVMDGFREAVFIFFCTFAGPGVGTSRGSPCSRL